MFKNIPLVFCGLDKRDPGIDVEEALKNGIPVVLESKEIKDNMDFISKILPKLEHLYIINDFTGASVLINHVYEEEALHYEKRGIKTTVNFDGNLTKIAEDLQDLPKNSAVLFGSLFRDKENNYIPYYELNDLLNSSSVPIFSMSDSHLGRGVIGGYLLKSYPQGRAAALEALKILDQNTVPKNPIIVPAEWTFDYNILKKYNLSYKNLPKGAIVLNLPETFFEKHKKLVEYAFILFPILLISLVFAIINNYQKYKLGKKLAAQSYLQEVLLNNIQSSIFWIDNHSRVKGCNNSFCKLVNLSEKEIIGQKICEIFASLCQLPDEKNLFDMKDVEFRIDERVYRLRNQTFVDEEEDRGIVSIIVDITDKKQLEINTQFIIQQSKLAEIGEMLSAIVHQWKNPLVELSAVAHKMIHYDFKKKLTSKHIKEFYESIMTQTIYMGETIDGFRDFVRPSNKPIMFDVNTAIKDVLAILSYSIKYSNIHLEYNNNLEEKCFTLGYPNEFKQVLLNIVNNAKDSIEEEKRSNNALNGKIRIYIMKESQQLMIVIKDNGIGIKESIMGQIFNPFFTTKEKGDGFGLYMARLIIENKMKGSIKVETQNVGAKVLITVPEAKRDGDENSTT